MSKMTLHHIENILYLVSYNVRNNYYIFVCNYTFHGKFVLSNLKCYHYYVRNI